MASLPAPLSSPLLQPKALGRMANNPPNMGKINEAAKQFESVFMAEMIRPMLETVPVDDTFGGGRGEEVFRSMLADEYGKIMATSGGIGLASHVSRALLEAQAAGHRP